VSLVIITCLIAAIAILIASTTAGMRGDNLRCHVLGITSIVVALVPFVIVLMAVGGAGA